MLLAAPIGDEAPIEVAGVFVAFSCELIEGFCKFEDCLNDERSLLIDVEREVYPTMCDMGGSWVFGGATSSLRGGDCRGGSVFTSALDCGTVDCRRFPVVEFF